MLGQGQVCTEAGATPSCRTVASDCTALVAPASAHQVSRKYLARIFPDLFLWGARYKPDAFRIISPI